LLDYLKVENFAVVEKAELRFSPNLNVLTGETGAGKSIVIGAINHFLNKKVPDNVIRGEDNNLVVEAMFTQGEDEYVLRREVSRKKSLCFINSNMVPFFQLKEKAESLLNIYGQNEHIFLLNAANHRLFLDEYSRNQELLDGVSRQYQVLKELLNQLDALKRKGEKTAANLDFINFQIEEINNLKMNVGDDELYEQRLKILSSAEEILTRANGIIGDFYQKDVSVYNLLAKHLKDMDYLKEIYPELSGLNDELKHFYDLLPELSNTLSNLIGHVEYNEDQLNDLSDKLLRLNRLKSKYHMDLGQLLKKRDDLVKEKNLLLDMNFSLKESQKIIDQGFDLYLTLNVALRQRRQKKAAELSKIIEMELRKLEMPKAKFIVMVEEIEPSLDLLSDKGTDRVEFYFSSNPGQEPGRIKDIASGGELSRLMLVLKSIIRDDIDSTYIFDEIDAGIGGKTAEFVGEKLKRISENNQVICISHLPQIASFADNHFLVSKEFKKNQTYSYVNQLSLDERVNEIGRLMVGSNVNEDVLKAARSLLEKNINRK